MTTEIPAGAESPVAHSGKPSDSAALRSSVAGAVMLALSAVSGPAPAQSAPSAPVSASGAGVGKIKNVSATDGLKFSNGDFVLLETFTNAPGTAVKIKKISIDGKYIVLDTTADLAAAGTIKLAVGDEANGLIADKTDKSKAVVNEGSSKLPY